MKKKDASTAAPTKAERVRTLAERFEDACSGITSALRAHGHDGIHDDRPQVDKADHRQWFVAPGGHSDGKVDRPVARIVLETKVTWRGDKPADPKLCLSVDSQPNRGTYGSKAQTVPFKAKADGSFNCESVVSAAYNMVERRAEEIRARDERKAAQEAESDVEEQELAKLPQALRSEGVRFATRPPGWDADRIRGQPSGGDPVYVVQIERLRMPLSHLEKVVKLLAEFEHADHGRGHEGPDEPDCPCRETEKQERCALLGCGFCPVENKE